MKRKGFTLIELLAVIIILGILMLIAIPSVTNYINNSRKNTYVSTINELLKGTINKVNSGELNLFDTDTTYYVPSTCIKLENGEAKSPYGKFDPAYVVVTFDGDNYHYYFTGKDVQNMGVPTLTSFDILSKESILPNVSSIDTTVGIEGTSNVYVFSDECNGEGELGFASTTVSGGGVSSGNVSGPLCKKAKTLHTAICNYDSWGCGLTIGVGNTITYGTIPSGTPKGGDAYDCDVNNDGIYDEETERFYYITNYYDLDSNTFDNTRSVLIYYSNINGQQKYKYAEQSDSQAVGTCPTSGGCNWYGPVTAYKYLPDTSEWSNPKIIEPGIRSIKNELGTDTTLDGTYTLQPFSYTDKAARLLTTQEFQKMTGWNTPFGLIDSYNFMMENIGTYETGEGSGGYWFENPKSDASTLVWDFNGGDRSASARAADFTLIYGVRPVITVKTSDIK